MSIDKRLAIKPALNQFNGGEISPYLEGRYDWDKYNYSAKLCKNFIPTVEGYLRRRGGSRFVARKKGSQNVSFKIRVRTDDSTQPTLTINGQSVQLTQITGQSSSNPPVTIVTDLWETDTLTYLDGTELVYVASATGYVTKSGTITVDINQHNVEIDLSQPSGETKTVKFITPSSAVVTLGGTTTKTITGSVGTTVAYSVAYGGQTVTGNFTISEDKNYYVYKKNNDLIVSDSLVIKTSSVSNGTLYLPQCQIRYIGVGGGGGAFKYSSFWFGAGSGAGCDIILNVTEGQYDYNVGALGESRLDAQGYSSGATGSSSSLSLNSTTLVSNGGGGGGKLSGGFFYGGSGGTNTINNSYLSSTNWAKNGNACPYNGKSQSGSLVRGASVYSNYGTGSGYTDDSDLNSFQFGTNGYLYISFVGE